MMAGTVVDARDTANSEGSLTVRSVSSRGVFAYMSTASLANTALLTGASVEYPLTVASTSDDDRVFPGLTDVTGGSSCSSSSPASSFALSGCTVTLTDAHSTGADAASVSAEYAGHTTTFVFAVYLPSDVAVTAGDTQLRRLRAASSSAPVVCPSGTSMS